MRRYRAPVTRLLVLPLLVLWALTACGGAEAGDGSSGIRGRALAGPRCPIETAGSPCPDAPWQGTVVATEVGSNERHTVATDVDGRFRLALPPGTYELTIDADGELPFAKPQRVTIDEGEVVDVIVSVDTGIR
jgi:Carboxypeptidase regulatory-like domain